MSEKNDSTKRMTRRDFVKGAAVGAAGAAALGALASCAPATTPVPTEAPEPTSPPAASSTPVPAATPLPGVPEEWDYEADVVVVGSGNGGFNAAIAAAKAGAKVIVVEISSTTGGAAQYCSGVVHTMGNNSWDDFVKYSEGRFNQELAKAFWENYVPNIEWLVAIGAAITPMEPPAIGAFLGKGEPYPTCDRVYFDSLGSIFEEDGGTVLLNTSAREILTDEEGSIVGLRARGPEGALNIKAKALILACGGFFSNLELRQKYIGGNSAYTSVLGTPYNMGDGMRMAQEVGAALSGFMANVCSGTGPAYPFKNPQTDPEEYERRGSTAEFGEGKGEYWLVGYHRPPKEQILVNWDGKRFFDESSEDAMRGNHEYFQGPNFWAQRRAEAFSVYDGAMWDAVKDNVHTRTDIGDVTIAQCLDLLREYGGIVATADTIEALAEELAALNPGMHRANFLKTVDEYNKAVTTGTTDELEVPRTGVFAQIETPPFYAVLVTHYIVQNLGGVSINGNAQVLDSQRQVIPGLYAVPPTADCGLERYLGGVSQAGTFGYIAGNHAAKV